ncbi:MAG TPA: phosphoribosylaminoimidazolesuccinocarboxamide synthase [Planctomycetota bacterium]|nr:phosphoribosylaminoimidazolesuccinocarboxamide synthase [Planctomycetota bacterium]
MDPIFETNLPGFKLLARGKVRDVYDLGDKLLIVSTDRLSAFDSVIPTPIPDKGRVLNGLSRFWFSFLGDNPRNHLITADVELMGHGLEKHRAILSGRSMLVVKAKVFPIECVVRGYLMGSGWKEYQQKGSVCGIPLPRGLKNGSRLDQPIFTPATKATEGHDENITFEQAAGAIGQANAEKLRDLSISIYKRAAEHALSKNIIIADTKFEFGQSDGQIILVDEVLTPDSSRFWPREQWTPGQTQYSFDKQFVRDYLEGIGWNKLPPAPPLPEVIVQKTREKYVDAYRRITGHEQLPE